MFHMHFVNMHLQKHHLQETFWVNSPPTTGPSELANAHTPPMIPKYAPRSRTEKRSDMAMLTSVIKPPPPIPWTTRAAMSMSMLTDTPARSEPIKKIAFVSKSIGFLPKMSDTLPHTRCWCTKSAYVSHSFRTSGTRTWSSRRLSDEVC